MRNFSNPILKDILKTEYVLSSKLTILVKKYIRCKDERLKESLRNEIFTNSIRFIRKVACKCIGYNMDFMEDAFQAACVEFFRGLDKFDPKVTTGFLTYIHFWLIKGIRDEFHSRNIIHIPKKEYKNPAVEQIKNYNLIYSDKATGKDKKLFEHSFMVDHHNYFDDLDRADEANNVINIAKKYLSDIEYCIFKLRYFYENQPTYHEIGGQLNIKHERVRQIEARGLYKIKCKINDRPCHLQDLKSTKWILKNPDEAYAEILKGKSHE